MAAAQPKDGDTTDQAPTAADLPGGFLPSHWGAACPDRSLLQPPITNPGIPPGTPFGALPFNPFAIPKTSPSSREASPPISSTVTEMPPQPHETPPLNPFATPSSPGSICSTAFCPPLEEPLPESPKKAPAKALP